MVPGLRERVFALLYEHGHERCRGAFHTAQRWTSGAYRPRTIRRALLRILASSTVSRSLAGVTQSCDTTIGSKRPSAGRTPVPKWVARSRAAWVDKQLPCLAEVCG